MVETENRWYVLRVQSNKEDTVKESLEKRIKAAGLDTQIVRVLVPTEKVSEIKGGKKRVSERKIYPGYVLVEMVLNDNTWYLVRETPGIGDFVGVDKVLGEADREPEQPKLKIDFREGDSVKINEGPFENFSGIVKEVLPSKGVVRVEVTIFGRPTPVELEYWQVESI
jgi:transcriptional antiterminator NusG